MTIKTTCIGAFPKPDYISVTNWSESGEQDCGLIMLDRDLAMKKLANLSAAARATS